MKKVLDKRKVVWYNKQVAERTGGASSLKIEQYERTNELS